MGDRRRDAGSGAFGHVMQDAKSGSCIARRREVETVSGESSSELPSPGSSEMACCAALVYDKGLHATYSTRYLAHKIRYLTANLPFSAKLRIFNSTK